MADLVLTDAVVAVALDELELMVMMLRAVIGDTDSDNYMYTDERLQMLLATAAKVVFSEIYLVSANFSLSISDLTDGTFTITPTPTDIVISLIVTKAACLLNQAELRYKMNIEGFKAVCGESAISNSAGSSSWGILIEKGPCAAYTELKRTIYRDPLLRGDYFKAILSPFINYNLSAGRHC